MNVARLLLAHAGLLFFGLACAAHAHANAYPHVVLVGDSTVTEQSGWGLGFRELAAPNVRITNMARGGRSSKSYRDEGHWDAALAAKGDVYLIQFGHNDQPGKGPERETDPETSFAANLARYVDEVRAIGARPVLVTSLTRRTFSNTDPGRIASTLGPYAEATKRVARERGVPAIDLHALSIALCERVGPEETAKLNPANTDGTPDRTHLGPAGSRMFARLVVSALGEVASDLGSAFRTPPTGSFAEGGALDGVRHRVLVSTDIGGTDPDDFQSMVHLLLYADVFDLEGLVSSPFGPGRKEHILEVIDYYEKDFSSLRTHADGYPTPDTLRAMTKQGETEVAPYAGVRRPTEGSEWIVQCARRDDPRPLHVLVWGGIEDLAQALHDAPDILPKLRVHWVGGPNKKWSPDAYHYLATHHKDLWIIESNATYRGWFVGGNQDGEWGNRGFVETHVAGRGALGSYFTNHLEGIIKMGDTPTVSWLLRGTPANPAQPGWGGRFVRAWERPHSVYRRLTTAADRIEHFGILELILPLEANPPAQPEAQMIVENQSLIGHVDGEGNLRFRFCPKDAKLYRYEIRSNVASLHGANGEILSVSPSIDAAIVPAASLPNWWTDDPSPALADGSHHGTRTVNQWREAYLRDFAARMRRTSLPQTSSATTAVSLLAAAPAPAEALRVDINAVDRSDMRTEGWENWEPAGRDVSRTFGGVTVTVRAARGAGTLAFDGNKAIVVPGVTVGADAAVVSGGQPSVMEVEFDGLAPGPHTWVGYHHALEMTDGALDVSLGDRNVGAIQPSRAVRHNDEITTSFLEFEAKAGEPVVIRIASAVGGRALLSGFALDVPNPVAIARKPLPADGDRHVDGDDGTVALSWTPSPSAVRQRVYLVHGNDIDAALRKLAEADEHSEGFVASVEGGSVAASVVPRNSLLHYAWRVDSADAQGNVTRGEPWHFRVRHPAFPTAEGYGRFALGGRGGRVMRVTNLDDSGPGSLREAVEATGPRTVVFDVSGIITLKSKLVFGPANEFLTIAGQTAPGKGICIRGFTFGGVGARDTIIRFVRLRLGDLNGTMDGMGLAGSNHCIIDHCSISWTIDEAFSSRGAKNITFQRNLISEALNIAGHSHYGQNQGHGYAGSIGGDVGSFHHNLLAHNAGRNWSLAGSIDQANRHAGRLDIRNMVVYNWRNRTTDGGAREVNFVNNYYKPGPATQLLTYLNPQFENPAFGPQQYYVEGNIMEGVAGPEGPTGPFKGMSVRGRQDAPTTVPTPFFEPFVTTHSAKEAYENVLADVGANVPLLDDHDKRVIREVRDGTATFKGSRSGLPGLPDSQSDVGGWEEYPEIHRPADWDTDGDGLPGWWEGQRGLDAHDPSDGAADPDGDGYTYLEDYLNWLAAGNGPSNR